MAGTVGLHKLDPHVIGSDALTVVQSALSKLALDYIWEWTDTKQTHWGGRVDI